MTKRKSRSEIVKKDVDFMKPLTIEDFTVGNDPCFGKHHDISADECIRCGDAEVCSIITAQTQGKERRALSKKEPVKTYHDEADRKALRKYIKKRVDKGYSTTKILKLVNEKWDVPKKKVKNLIKKYS